MKQTNMIKMKTVLILTTLLPAMRLSDSQCGHSSDCIQGTVINGKPTCSLEFPWHVTITKPSFDQNQLQPICGASIITRRFLISAAHCFVYSVGEPEPNPLDYRVYPQLDNRFVEDPRYHYIKQIHIHTDWMEHPGDFGRGNDLAIIELTDTLNFNSSISPICLPTPMQQYLKDAGRAVQMAGFGYIKSDSKEQPTILQKGEHTIVNCDSENNICADQVKNGNVVSSSCLGDSGGGLVGRDGDDGPFIMIGVVSWGKKCAAANFNSRYVDLFKPGHLDWINRMICRTEEGNICILPFKYRQTNYTECLNQVGSKTFKAVCPTAVDNRGEGINFKTCKSQCPGYKEAVDGGYGPWSNWSPCSKSCGGGHSTRKQRCDDPVALVAKYGGTDCNKDKVEQIDCNVMDCPFINKTVEINPPETDCVDTKSKCYNVDWLRKNKKCSKLVKLYDDFNEGITTEWETIFAKNCNLDPFGICCDLGDLDIHKPPAFTMLSSTTIRKTTMTSTTVENTTIVPTSSTIVPPKLQGGQGSTRPLRPQRPSATQEVSGWQGSPSRCTNTKVGIITTEFTTQCHDNDGQSYLCKKRVDNCGCERKGEAWAGDFQGAVIVCYQNGTCDDIGSSSDGFKVPDTYISPNECYDACEAVNWHSGQETKYIRTYTNC